LDVLRGVAIVTMVLSGTVPWKGLPAWMYHAQIPPPNRVFDPSVPGLTWVDLVFPFFLFSLGAALPLALQKKLQMPHGVKTAVTDGFRRFGLLVYFALMVQNLNPIRLQGWKPDMATWAYASGPLTMLACTFVLMRLPHSLKPTIVLTVRALGAALSIALLAFVPSAFGHPFTWRRTDIILIVLSNVALFGTLTMVAFQKAPNWKYSLLLLGLFIHGCRNLWPDNPVRWVTDLGPIQALFGSAVVDSITWAFHPRYLKYLFIVLPGVAAGEILVRYLSHATHQQPAQPASPKARWAAFALMTLVLLGTGAFLGFHLGRQIILAFVATVATLGLAWLALGAFIEQPAAQTAIRNLLFLTIICLLWGFVFEGYQGGAKKDHATLSYYGYGAGFAALFLAAFLALEAFCKLGPGLRLMAANGQNPMVAYVASAFFVQPLLHLTGLWSILTKWTQGAWPGTGRAVFITLLSALLTAFLGRCRVTWRS
jgi:predicted acyltransferase